MGFFDYFFGSGNTYSPDMKLLSRDDIRIIVSRARVKTLDQKEELAVEEAIDHARLDGRISMKKIDETLRHLVSNRTISINDKKGLLTQFEHHFTSQK